MELNLICDVKTVQTMRGKARGIKEIEKNWKKDALSPTLGLCSWSFSSTFIIEGDQKKVRIWHARDTFGIQSEAIICHLIGA
jgi:hypothetical protein